MKNLAAKFIISVNSKEMQLTKADFWELYTSSRSRSTTSWIQDGILCVQVVGTISDNTFVAYRYEEDLVPTE